MAGFSFAKASFVASSSSGEQYLNINDPNFWEKASSAFFPDKFRGVFAFFHKFGDILSRSLANFAGFFTLFSQISRSLSLSFTKFSSAFFTNLAICRSQISRLLPLFFTNSAVFHHFITKFAVYHKIRGFRHFF
jgi:hypothetical protein